MKALRVAPLLLLLAFPSTAADKGIVASEILSCTERELPCGNSIESQLIEASCVTTCGESAEVWRVHAFLQTTLVTVTATSAAFDPRLDLIDPSGTLIDSNDSVGGTNAAQISRVLEPGSYLFRVVGQPAGATGDYSLSLHCHSRCKWRRSMLWIGH